MPTVLGVALALIAVTACADESEQSEKVSGPPTSSVDESTGPTTVTTIEWEPCSGFECGSVTVPLRYDASGEASTDDYLELAVIRRPASGRARGTIFVNPGGPGASGIDFVRAGFDLGPEVGARFHLVGFDPRGVGASAGLGCGHSDQPAPRPDSSPDDEEERRLLDEEARSTADECARLDNELLATISTSVAARDLEYLRRSVGDDTLHYYGLSYGTLLGLRYAQLHPEQVGRMVLDGVVDPSLDLQALLRLQATAFEDAFLELDRRCGTPTLAGCPEDGLATTFDRLQQRLEAEGPIGDFGTTELSYAALVALYSPDLWPVLAGGLADAVESDVARLQALTDRLTDSVQFTSYAAYLCQDSPLPGDREQWARFADDLSTVAPRFGATVANELLTCVYWPATGLDRPARISAPGAGPILVIGTTQDPATPLVGAQRVADSLDRSRLLVVEGFHHTAIGFNSCVADVVDRFLIDSILPATDTRCRQDGEASLTTVNG